MAHNKENLVVSHTRKAIHPVWNTKKLPAINIVRLFDVLTNFPFTTSETMCDYYL